ncbi:hypothetical protein AJ79_02815 [Helicocarpus griseus UAMH5409]|uniref:Pleckstrin homology domain-containing protein n=1 Tax=Helicocarpus griseus UAMH5409 TaxID=1447875 RepID=A0A2B7Y0V7_9EURO|nr:hypothetical protein AJ79_02815 [Helicocarpus griseus UAMH5409]
MASDGENDYGYLAKPLPTPSDTSYRIPAASMSSRRPSLPRRTSSPGPSSSPSRFSANPYESEGPSSPLDVANDETISPLDPRRFTPTLHASLVSEILSLRREMESKTREMDNLEIALEDTKAEAETIAETLSKTTKENRSLKRQLNLLEGGSLSAMTELSRERDEALESISDAKKRLEQSQKRARTQEEELERAQMLWERDRQNWDEERRNWERKVHVVEGRLKLVLNEVAAAQAAGSYSKGPDGEFEDSIRDGTTARGSDTNSIRSNSVLSRRRTSTASVSTHDGEPPNHLRYSVISLANGHGTKLDGLNLADELAFDEEEEDTMSMDDRPDSRSAVPDERPMSMQSRMSVVGPRRTLDMPVDGFEGFGSPDALGRRSRNLDMIPDIEDDAKTTTALHFEYRDVGIQYTPPPSPKIAPEPNDDIPILDETTTAKDKSHINKEAPAYQSKDSSTVTVTVQTTSSACQTTGDLPSPPWTPKVDESLAKDSAEAPAPAPAPVVATASISTQTDDVIIKDKETHQLEEAIRRPMTIPTITIEPPGSNPPSARNSVVLPPQTKSISCQTEIKAVVDVRSCGMQTEEIRVDKRPVKLPATLLPSAIIDRPASPDSIDLPPIQPFRAPPPKSAKRRFRNPPPVEAPPAPRAPSRSREPERLQAYPGNNDNGPLSVDVKPELRRPFRTSSLFAGFEHISDDEWPDPPEDIFTDDELFNRPLASYTLRGGKLVSKAKTPPSILDDNPLEEREKPPEDDEQHSPRSVSAANKHSMAADKTSNGKRPPRPLKLGNVAKQPDIRRTAMISSSTAAHQAYRPRSPSAPSIGSSGASSSTAAKPPFPVPVRLSSRKVPTSASEGAQSPTPYSNGNFPERNGRSRDPPLRKVRSDAVVSRMHQPSRQQSHSPPAMSTSSAGRESPQLPPMPFDEITAPHSRRPGNMHSSRRPQLPAKSHRRQESNATSAQPTSVVDAIAQTMVGEWMWKYVRRRKSFGMSDNTKDGWEVGKTTEEVSANITGNGVRHKRWVWLAPYERAVMWSSKQPTSGHALLGKSGRKLTIQSVLDVKDDNPLPKGSSPNNQFNRSILILTPQRALKFTALTVERHIVWLTALSFLSHSSMGPNDLASLPPVPHEEYPPPPANASLRRNPIRDSIRVAKGKTKAPANSNRPFPSQPAVPEMPFDEDDENDPIADAADPPNVPRFSSHARKRSNTAPRLPPSSFRSFSNHTTAPSTYSNTTAGSSDLYSPSAVGPSGVQSGRSSVSHRTSEASGPSSVGMNNFFEAVGTVRMEAFVDGGEQGRPRGGGHSHSRRPRGGGGGRRRRDAHYWPPNSPETDFPGSEDGDVFFRHEDPFRGF